MTPDPTGAAFGFGGDGPTMFVKWADAVALWKALPALVALVAAAEAYVDLDDRDRNTYGLELALDDLEKALP
jgi:hypothetical protein